MSQETADESESGSESLQGFEFEDYYDLLNVDSDADKSEILSGYREMVKDHHPDTSSLPMEEAERRFEQLVDARETLEDPRNREAYDSLGHAKYIKQSADLGRHLRPADIDESESDSGEGNKTTQSGEAGTGTRTVTPPSGEYSQERQTSIRGEARAEGEQIPTALDDAFTGGNSRRAEQPDADESTERDSIFSIDQNLSTTSLQFVGQKWGQSWRTRALVTCFGVPLLLVGIQLLPIVGSQASVELPLIELSQASVFGLFAVAAVGATLKTCLSQELALPAGGFVDDRELARFTPENASAYLSRGILFLGAPVVLLLLSAMIGAGPNPWDHTAATLQGDYTAGFLWFPLETLGLEAYSTFLDVVLLLVFVLGAVIGLLYLSLGLSISVWRGRYLTGRRLRPSLWDSVTTLAIVAVGFSLVAGSIPLGAVPTAETLPSEAQTFLALSEGDATTGTLASLGLVSVLSLPTLYKLRITVGEWLTAPTE